MLSYEMCVIFGFPTKLGFFNGKSPQKREKFHILTIYIRAVRVYTETQIQNFKSRSPHI